MGGRDVSVITAKGACPETRGLLVTGELGSAGISGLGQLMIMMEDSERGFRPL